MATRRKTTATKPKTAPKFVGIVFFNGTYNDPREVGSGADEKAVVNKVSAYMADYSSRYQPMGAVYCLKGVVARKEVPIEYTPVEE